MKARVNERPRQLGKSAVSLAVPGAKATARNAKQLYSVRIVTRSVLDTARSQRSACCWFASGGTPQQAYRGVAAGVRDALLCLLAPCACRLCSRRTAAAVVVRQHAAFNHACSGSVLCHPAANWNSPRLQLQPFTAAASHPPPPPQSLSLSSNRVFSHLATRGSRHKALPSLQQYYC